MKVTLYIAASLDGYIAGPNGEIDWLSMVDRPGEDYGYHEFYDSVDSLVMGRKTYDLAVGFGEWPYAGKPSFVFTRQHLDTDRTDVTFVSGQASGVLDMMRAQGLEHVWLVGGGELDSAFLSHGLIDEFIISYMPIVLGTGIQLFPPPCSEQRLDLIDSKQYASGLIQVHYRPVRGG